jgi:ADP-ribose pyrophosphatase YjhB (NUDIX family)
VHVDESILAPIRAQFGTPVVLHWQDEVSEEEMELIRRESGRRHDVTLFIFDPEGRLALIQKPSYPPDVWRPPGGGVRAGEDFVCGVGREGLEETGVEISLRRYLVRTEAMFRLGRRVEPWQTHVFSASTEARVLIPVDTHEIAAARWGTTAELGGPIRRAILSTGRPLWRYRAALHDAALEVLGTC